MRSFSICCDDAYHANAHTQYPATMGVLTEDTKAFVTELFAETDADGSGTINAEEIHTMITKVAEKEGFEAPSQEVSAICLLAVRSIVSEILMSYDPFISSFSLTENPGQARCATYRKRGRPDAPGTPVSHWRHQSHGHLRRLV
jgi:hypothetical protein